MKIRVMLMSLLFSGVVIQPAGSGEIVDSYNAGDTLTSGMMDNIKAAVNDNDANKQNRVSGTCPSGQSIREINENGSVVCEVDTDTDTTYNAGPGIFISGATIGARVGVDATLNQSTVFVSQGDTSINSVASVYMSLPVSGYVLVTHTGYVVTFNEPNTIRVGVGDSASAFDGSVSVGSLDASSTRRYQFGYSAQYMYYKTAGNYTFYGLAQKNTTFDAGDVNVIPEAITAMFFPNRY